MPTVHAHDEQDRPIDVERWVRLARGVLQAENVPANSEVSITFVDEVEIALLNERYMGEQTSTDVLSFPIDGPEARDAATRAPAADSDEDSDAPLLLGDVVICPAVAERNAPLHPGTHAPLHSGSADDELALLVVHGVLHLLGYDHATAEEEASMQARERHLLSLLHSRDAR